VAPRSTEGSPLPVDAALPQLPMALDADAMAGVFEALVREQRPALQVQACAIEGIKYRPRRNVAVCYRLLLREGQGGAPFEQIVATRFCAPGQSERRFANACARAPIGTPLGAAASLVPGLELVAAWWPNDAKLGLAAELLCGAPAQRDRIAGDAVAALTGGRGELVSHRFEIVQRIPEHRLCARVDLSYRSGPGAQTHQRTLYVKADAQQRGQVTHAVMQALFHSEAQRSGRLKTPEPILWQGEAGLHWQAALPGSALLDAAPSVDTMNSFRVGSLLAALHATRVPAMRRTGSNELQERLQLVVQTLAMVEPGWERALRRLELGLAQGITGVLGEPDVTLHGDLHPRNVLVAADGPALIDLDSARLGAPLHDLGDWFADTLYRALLCGHDIGDALASCRAFLRGYAAGGGSAAPEAWLAWSTANSLLCQRAWRCVVNLKPGRYALVEPLLRMAGAIQRAGSINAAAESLQQLAA
jgi:Phosphotransferase enzyme family